MVHALKVAAMSCVLAAAAGDSILNRIKDFGDCPDGKLNDCTEVRARLVRQYPMADVKVVAMQRGSLNTKVYTPTAIGDLVLDVFDYQWKFPNFKKGMVQTAKGTSSNVPIESDSESPNGKASFFYNDGRWVFSGATAQSALITGAFVWTDDFNPAMHFVQIYDGSAAAAGPDAAEPRETLFQTMACSAADTKAIAGCTWLVRLTLKSMPSGTGLLIGEAYVGRRAAAAADQTEPLHHHDDDTAAAADEDADRELLQLLMMGDGDAHDHFHRSGGRVLGDGAVVMPSGRRLDDGSVITVGFIYTDAAREALGGDHAAVRSRISAAVNSANVALENSSIGFRFDAVIGTTGYREPATGGLTAIVREFYISGRVEWGRDTYRLDLAQIVAVPGTFECSVGAQLTHISTALDRARIGLSAVNVACLTSSSWASLNGLARNLGAQGLGTDFASEWPYAHAYTTCGVVGAPFTYQTIMGASSPRCLSTVRLATFSSAVDWDSYWLLFRRGGAARDNAHVLQGNRLYVANYRSSA